MENTNETAVAYANNQLAYVESLVNANCAKMVETVFANGVDKRHETAVLIANNMAVAREIQSLADALAQHIGANKTVDNAVKTAVKNAMKTDGVPDDIINTIWENFPLPNTKKCVGNGGTTTGFRRFNWQLTNQSAGSDERGRYIILHCSNSVSAKQRTARVYQSEMFSTHTSHIDNVVCGNQKSFIIHLVNEIMGIQPPIDIAETSGDVRGVENGIRNGFNYIAKNANGRP